MKNNTDPKTNTELLCLALGWQGGTVHQVAEATGLTAAQIINTDRMKEGESHGNGFSAVRTCSLEFNRTVNFPARQGNLSFWMGVARGQETLEKFPRL